MTNHEILGFLQKTRLRLHDLDVFIKKVRIISSSEQDLLSLYGDVAAFDGGQPAYLGQVNQELSRVVSEVQGFSSREFFESAYKVNSIFNQAADEVPVLGPIAGKVLYELDALQNAFDSFTQKHSTDRALKVVFKAHSFVQAIDSYVEYTELIGNSFRSDHATPEQAGTLELYMPAELNFEEFIERLNSIKTIYQELAQIVGVSISDEPLKILKVESGSLWASLFGNSKIMALMDDLLRSAARYMHRNFTREGKIEALPTSLKGMNEILDFTKRLEENGVDVTAIHDQLVKGTFLVAKEMNVLLENQSSVTINGEDIRLSGSMSQGQLEARRVPRLQDRSQNT
jgi:hypothetical protein